MTKFGKIGLVGSLLIYLFVNSLFVYKYSLRVCDFPWGITLIYCLCIALIAYFALPHLSHTIHAKRWIWILGSCALFGGLVLQYSINPLNINVDRWSAIHNWIRNFFSGIYPYSAQTHLNGYGSPFPIWQLFHIPFYWMGNVALSSFVVCIVWIVTTTITISPQAGLINLLGLVLAPAFWYEISTRSDLMANIIMSLMIVEWLLYKKNSLTDNYIKIGILAGLLLSTRLIGVIPLCIAYGYEFFLIPWSQKIKLLGIGIGTFTITFLPFVFWKGSTLLFFQYSPFVLQTRQGSPIVFIVWLTIVCVWLIAFKQETFHHSFSIGILLFILICLAATHTIYDHTFANIFTSSSFDITYFSSAIPFTILYVTIFNTTMQKNRINESTSETLPLSRDE